MYEATFHVHLKKIIIIIKKDASMTFITLTRKYYDRKIKILFHYLFILYIMGYNTDTLRDMLLISVLIKIIYSIVKFKNYAPLREFLFYINKYL